MTIPNEMCRPFHIWSVGGMGLQVVSFPDLYDVLQRWQVEVWAQDKAADCATIHVLLITLPVGMYSYM